jgi:hypothetical protein
MSLANLSIDELNEMVEGSEKCEKGEKKDEKAKKKKSEKIYSLEDIFKLDSKDLNNKVFMLQIN